MYFSIFTPTNNPEHLIETYASLLRQTVQNWEWVIVPNGDALKIGLHTLLSCTEDDRVRIVDYPQGLSHNIGALKNFACSLTRGKVLVELDHDDWLLPDCLSQLGSQFDRKADFVYSDAVHFKPDHSSLVYTKPKNGWVDYGFDFDNRHYRVPRTPLVCPRSLADIYYAPDHVRAWKAELYRKIGGHDINLAVGDDHDLLCRTYLANAKMVKIEQPLYMYREGEQNTYSKNLEKIREVSNANKDKYLRRMGERWCRDNGHPMIDMGAARAFGKKDGYLRLDISDEKGIDIVHDATKPLPWPDSSIGIFHCQDFLEHIPIGKTVQLMNEFYRCLVPGGWLHSSTPSTDGRGAFQDPTHVSFWNSNSFWYYTSAGHRGMVPEIKTEFQAVRVTNSYPGKFCETHKILYVNADLIAMKGQPQIGPVNF